MSEGDWLDKLAKFLPVEEVYRDVAQPTARDIGTGIQTIFRLLTYPLYRALWSKDELRELLFEPLAERLRHVPEDRKTSPRPAVAMKSLEGLLLVKDEPELRKMYLNLLAASMDAETAENAHPAFVEVLGQLTPDEARILKLFARQTSFSLIRIRDEESTAPGVGKDVLRHFSLLGHDAGCDHLGMVEVYLENLQRLGVIILRMDNRLSDEVHYEKIESHPLVLGIRKVIEDQGRMARVERGAGYVTTFGKQLVIACVGDAGFSSPVLPIYRVEHGRGDRASG